MRVKLKAKMNHEEHEEKQAKKLIVTISKRHFLLPFLRQQFKTVV